MGVHVSSVYRWEQDPRAHAKVQGITKTLIEQAIQIPDRRKAEIGAACQRLLLQNDFALGAVAHLIDACRAAISERKGSF